jgi:hypothetical protein
MKSALAALVAIAIAVAIVYPNVRPKPRRVGYCGDCHEMGDSSSAWLGSAHRGVACSDCHGGVLQMGNARRLGEHARGVAPEQIRVHQWPDVEAVVERCGNCHQEEFATWRAGPHAMTYAQAFTDRDHNRKRILMEDCFRCHGMHFQGSLGDMVTPIDTKGPWRLVDAGWAERAAIPCLACHQMHRPGQPEAARVRRPESAGALQAMAASSLALFDRRAQGHIALDSLPLPEMVQGRRRVKMSPDRRQALCYQCHAAGAAMQAGDGDDRTPVGIHEGIGCLACHQGHGERTRASCANCHPRMSNCGLDVEKMDTTFRSRSSRHNIHFFQCVDCHTHGVPKRRDSAGVR